MAADISTRWWAGAVFPRPATRCTAAAAEEMLREEMSVQASVVNLYSRAAGGGGDLAKGKRCGILICFNRPINVFVYVKRHVDILQGGSHNWRSVCHRSEDVRRECVLARAEKLPQPFHAYPLANRLKLMIPVQESGRYAVSYHFIQNLMLK